MAGLESGDVGLLARCWSGACVRQRTSLGKRVSITGQGQAVGRPRGSRGSESGSGKGQCGQRGCGTSGAASGGL